MLSIINEQIPDQPRIQILAYLTRFAMLIEDHNPEVIIIIRSAIQLRRLTAKLNVRLGAHDLLPAAKWY